MVRSPEDNPNQLLEDQNNGQSNDQHVVDHEMVETIRCRQCGERVNASLVICSYCGRELKPAPPRILSWGAPTVIAALLVASIIGWRAFGPAAEPVTSVPANEADGQVAAAPPVAQITAQLEPRVIIDEEEPLVLPDVAYAAVTREPSEEADQTLPISSTDDLTATNGISSTIIITRDQVTNDANIDAGEQQVAIALIGTPSPEPVTTSTDSPADDRASSETDEASSTSEGRPTAADSEPSSLTIAELRETSQARTRIENSEAATPTTEPSEADAVDATELDASGSTTPSATVTSRAPTPEPTASAEATDRLEPTVTRTTRPTSTATQTTPPTSTPRATRTATRRATATERSTATNTATVTATATPTNSATTVPTATDRPTATPTATFVVRATPTPVLYQIQAGDTLLRIAQRYNTTVPILMQLNNLTEEDFTRLRPGQQIILPSAEAEREPDDSAQEESSPVEATPTPVIYTLQAGDNPLKIAQRFGISVDALLAANGLTREDARTLRIGQELIIPVGNQGSGNRAPAAPANRASGTYRLDAPILLSPQDNTPMSCRTDDSLVWGAVPFMAPADRYILHLGFVSGRDANDQPVVSWILEQERESNRTSWDLDTDYCSLAPQTYGRQWRWYVEVVDEDGRAVSPPSTTWAFSWN